MSVVAPRSLPEALAALAADPSAHVLAGGTDLMVEVNFGHRRPASVVALRNVTELAGWAIEGDAVVLRAGLTYAEMETPGLAAVVPALAQAARTVGSPQIRAAGTIGGNVGTASPAGDTLPVLYALDAVVVLASVRGRRAVPIAEFVTGPKRTVREPDELIVEVRVPRLDGPQEYLKIGTRNAMVIAVADLALVVDRPAGSVRCALGSVGPTVVRAANAETWLTGRVDWNTGTIADRAATVAEFAGRVAAAARPIDDHRSTAAYRRHGIEVLARRALVRAAARIAPGGTPT
jgi:CO/xanthine dehydrogenase FAD-binding subunit